MAIQNHKSDSNKLNKLNKEPKTKNKIIYAILVTILSAVALITGRYSVSEENQTVQSDQEITLADAEFQVHVIDVGQGDSILVCADGETMLIDAAESKSSTEILDYLASQNVTELNYAAATHMHADHIGSFPKVLEQIKPEHVIEPVYADSLIPTTKTYERYLDAVEATGAEYTAMKAGDSFTLGNAQITVLAPVDESAKDLNNTSLVLRIQYDDIVCLFTGDMEVQEEKTILGNLENLGLLKATFLKAGHHGSDTSSGEDFLAQVQPKYVAVSCGVNNKYGHPVQSTLDHLAVWTDQIYITAQQGDIVFYYDKDTKSCDITTSGKES
ncbi:MAG: MBL fold metallo-hydrolase [Oscillospiraceae bacterium]|nr:MBL fold metallo-hydrolase [Oscillospiraceae bacterium]